jgi:hypothetical protein
MELGEAFFGAWVTLTPLTNAMQRTGTQPCGHEDRLVLESKN